MCTECLDDPFCIPEFLRREVTPQSKAAGTRLIKSMGPATRVLRAPPDASGTEMRPKTWSPAAQAILAEQEKAKRVAQRDRLAQLKEKRNGQ